MPHLAIDIRKRLVSIYERLDAHFGPLHWWPGDSPFEVIVGAILTQNTAWRNVEQAINNLKARGLLSPEAILNEEDPILSDLIKPSGYHRVKTKILKAFIRFLYEEYGGNLDIMFLEDIRTIRKQLLVVKGIGEETADSILLYAGNKTTFVVDAYTRRIFERHQVISDSDTYSDVQTLCMRHLPGDVALYNQYHALLVTTGKFFCKTVPQCHGCPLNA
jgi:endonuclease-3 related protein